MLKTETIGNVTVAGFENEKRFNALITEPVKEQIKGFFKEPNGKVALSLDGINFIDSSGFGVFLSVLKSANSNSGQFKICSVREDVMELFKLLQLHNVFEIYPDVSSCVKSFD
ncbi:MAG: STAS domain-containing protein [Bacteroidales bacterium]|nr:STAS domain-containing protein [Bacteroidales bacterium]